MDIVVNNAAVLNPSTVVSEITDDDFAFVMDGNLRGSFHILRRAARDLRHDGRIINISTLDTTHASAGNALYAASKAAVEQLVAGIAQEVGSRGITANTVSPEQPTHRDCAAAEVTRFSRRQH
ncbi:MAG: SDR family oxidoreductase [Galbitalea sp.]